jgi:hypothetical protein
MPPRAVRMPLSAILRFQTLHATAKHTGAGFNLDSPPSTCAGCTWRHGDSDRNVGDGRKCQVLHDEVRGQAKAMLQTVGAGEQRLGGKGADPHVDVAHLLAVAEPAEVKPAIDSGVVRVRLVAQD